MFKKEAEMPEQAAAGIGAVNSTAGSVTTGGSVDAVEGTFDPRKMTLSQDYTSMVGVNKEASRVPIQRPPAQAFFVPHPDPAWQIQIAALELKEEREVYVVAPSLIEELTGEWVAKVLVPCVTRQGGLYLWPIRLPGEDGRIDSWNESALRIAREYAGRWVRLHPNRELGAYDVITPISVFDPPKWPENPDELLRKGFRDRVIDKVDHPVIKRLRGVA
jgi:hypothetical protein